ncbi:hypothetical protein D1007_27971 [Hordeum vulgare]|nr:hypothetical protein D1007_27971 [Hordeum vulgare]
MESRYARAASEQFFFFLESVDNGTGGRRRLLELDACFLCKRGIASDHHAYMYRGDAAFCSEYCRQEQMDMDAARAGRRRAPAPRAADIQAAVVLLAGRLHRPRPRRVRLHRPPRLLAVLCSSPTMHDEPTTTRVHMGRQ